MGRLKITRAEDGTIHVHDLANPGVDLGFFTELAISPEGAENGTSQAKLTVESVEADLWLDEYRVVAVSQDGSRTDLTDLGLASKRRLRVVVDRVTHLLRVVDVESGKNVAGVVHVAIAPISVPVRVWAEILVEEPEYPFDSDRFVSLRERPALVA